MKKLLKLTDVAHRLGVDQRTVRRWLLAGKGPQRYFRTPGGIYMFPADETEMWIESIINGHGSRDDAR
jgi:predicted site-specific integrase-resolvase